MGAEPKTEVFEKIYQDYLDQVGQVDLKSVQDRLGVKVDGDAVVIPFFGIPHRVTAQGVVDDQGRRPSHAVSVILCKYVLLCPEQEPQGSGWVSYKDFKDAAPFAAGFLNNAERPISLVFAGRLEELKQACEVMNGGPGDLEISSDLVVRFDALPKIPLMMLFNDQDEDFPAHCSLLFEARAEKFLDMECLAMIGWALSDRLKRLANADDGSALTL